jgi:minor extracellular protease Epr
MRRKEMMHVRTSWHLTVGLALTLAASVAARAQLLPPVPPVPDVGGTVSQVGRTGDDLVDRAKGTAQGLGASAADLADARRARLSDLVRANRDRLEMTDDGPAVRGEVIAIDPSPAAMSALAAAGFTVAREERIEGLDIRAVTLRVPRGWSVDRALSRLGRIAPGAAFAANHLHLQSGEAVAATAEATLAQSGNGGPSQVGLIDGGVARHPSLQGSIQQRGFVSGAPRSSAHGTAVASLIAGQGPVRGAAPGAPLLVADVFGNDPAGGNAGALARAIGWMAAQRVPVVAVSLVGPPNALVARAVSQARARGVHIVAAVGNDGPAAPPAYPASYAGVIAVTGIDGRGRVLAEAGRASRVDYAAPGADMAAAGANGRLGAVRGTSYAVPLVAGRLAFHVRGGRGLAGLDGEATDRGRRGVGRGIICGDCRTPYRR